MKLLAKQMLSTKTNKSPNFSNLTKESFFPFQIAVQYYCCGLKTTFLHTLIQESRVLLFQSSLGVIFSVLLVGGRRDSTQDVLAPQSCGFFSTYVPWAKPLMVSNWKRGCGRWWEAATLLNNTQAGCPATFVTLFFLPRDSLTTGL